MMLNCINKMEEYEEYIQGNLTIRIYKTKAATGYAAGKEAEKYLKETIDQNSPARIIIGAANSQIEIIETLTKSTLINWEKVTLFHMDEYVGIEKNHQASFRKWVKEHLVDKVNVGTVYYIESDINNTEKESNRYARLLNEYPIDLVLLGFGENGHIAFNEPHVANFYDPNTIQIVDLDETTRKQQVREGHFKDLSEVPQKALTLTCSSLFSAKKWIATVPEGRKAEAVSDALNGSISEEIPASLIRKHPNATLYLDKESSKKLRSKTKDWQ